MSLEEYNALEETMYLLRSPENARRILSAIESLNKGEGLERDITFGIRFSGSGPNEFPWSTGCFMPSPMRQS